jgi:hypothetical protein
MRRFEPSIPPRERRFPTAVLVVFSAFALTMFAADPAPNTLTAEEQSAGWHLLFDGKTTAGWRGFKKPEFPAKGWVIENGTLHRASGGGDIITTEQFDDFEFTFEWKIEPKGNSGVKYFIQEPRGPIGHEYQVWDDAGKPPNKHSAGALYDLIAPANPPVRPAGEWNQSRIVVKGTRCEHWLNGAKAAEYELGSEALKAAIAESKFKRVPEFGTKFKTPLLLQDHGSKVWYRNLKIRTLKP